MRTKFDLKWPDLSGAGVFVFSLFIFWIILLANISYPFSQYFRSYTPGLFLVVLILYSIAFRLQGPARLLVGLGLTMALLSLSLSYKWTSGFSDNFMIGGLLPYKDAKNYFVGANLLLNGLPMTGAGQATERPLFPGFLAVLLSMTGQNLRIAVAIIAQFVAMGIYFSAREILRSFGPLAAGLHATLLYFYIQPLIGYSLSEMLGFIAGCLGFALIIAAANRMRWIDLVLGTSVLMVAVSARAGAFFIFPMLALWAGWIFRGEKRFSLKLAACAMAIFLLEYLLINSLYSRLLDISSGNSFGNFSYAMYGQVRGGTGWHSAIEDLGTRNPTIVYRAAWEFFLQHPASLLIGVVKSYRDFFLTGHQSIFPYFKYGWPHWLDPILWLSMLVLIVRGMLRLVRDIHSSVSSLLVAGFAGILLSIPFLPPIDGGARFYASSMAFFFALPAAGISGLTDLKWQDRSSGDAKRSSLSVYRSASVALLLLVPVAPLLTYWLSEKPSHVVPDCSAQQKPFAINVHPGSYLDLVNNRSLYCSDVSRVCLGDFERNNVEKEVDDYYQHLLSFAKRNNAAIRIIPAIDLLENEFHYFYVPMDKIPMDSLYGRIAGCATENLTKNQTIYQVESILLDVK